MNIDKLKSKILQLAVHGKLTEQTLYDEPVEILLERIADEKEKLIKDKKIKKEKPLPEITDEEKPFDIPKGWKWCRFSQVLDVRDGTHDTPKYVEEGIPLITSKNINGKEIDFENVKYISLEDHEEISKRSKVDDGDILFAMIGSIGNPVIVKKKMDFSIKNVALFKYYKSNCVNNKFLYYYLLFIQDDMKKSSKGAVQSFVSLKILREYLFPLPSVTEQLRIVAKVDELFAIIDELAENKEEMLKNISDTRNKVLQLAIQGKLVEQCEEDEPVKILLQRISEEKEKLIKEKKIKKEKPLPQITEEEKLFELPKGWKFCRLPNVTIFQEGPGILAKDFREDGIPLIRLSGMKANIVSLDGCNYLDIDMVKKKWEHFKLDLNDIVISSSASMGKVARVDETTVGCIPYTGLIRFKVLGGILDKYFIYFIQSPFYISQIEAQKSGTTIKHYGPTHLKNMIIPIPPLEEQKHIVAKVDKIMSYLDELEKLILEQDIM